MKIDLERFFHRFKGLSVTKYIHDIYSQWMFFKFSPTAMNFCFFWQSYFRQWSYCKTYYKINIVWSKNRTKRYKKLKIKDSNAFAHLYELVISL